MIPIAHTKKVGTSICLLIRALKSVTCPSKENKLRYFRGRTVNVIVEKGKISYMYIKVKIGHWFTGESRMPKQFFSIGITDIRVTMARIGCKDSSFRSL